MSDDLVKRLRDNCSCNLPDTPCGAEEQCRNAFEAADHIEKLETANLKQSLIKVDDMARIEKLEHALNDCILVFGVTQDTSFWKAYEDVINKARKALEGTDD